MRYFLCILRVFAPLAAIGFSHSAPRGTCIPRLSLVYSLGAACVFFMKKSLSDAVQRSLTGFAAGVMVAASVWSLLIPAIEQSSAMGKLSFPPAFRGFWVGILF